MSGEKNSQAGVINNQVCLVWPGRSLKKRALSSLAGMPSTTQGPPEAQRDHGMDNHEKDWEIPGYILLDPQEPMVQTHRGASPLSRGQST